MFIILNLAYGLLVPIPTFPEFVTTKFVAVEEPMTKAGDVPRPFEFTERSPHGVVVPIPRKPSCVKVDVAVPPNDA